MSTQRGPEQIETERLRIRKARPEDLMDIWQNVWMDGSISQSMLWQPTLTEEEARKRMQRTILYQAQVPAYFVCERETDQAIGFCGVLEKEPGVYEDAGLCIAAAWQNRGLGKEMVRGLCHLVFDIFRGEKFVYGCFSDNLRSAAVCRACGFHYVTSHEGVRPYDGYHYVVNEYELSREEYERGKEESLF